MSKLQEILNETLEEIYQDQQQNIQENVQEEQNTQEQNTQEQEIQESIDVDQQMRITAYMSGLGALELRRQLRNK